MKTEDLKAGNTLRSRIKEIEGKIELLTGGYDNDKVTGNQKTMIDNATIQMRGNRQNVSTDVSSIYTEKANTNIKFLNQLYRDNVLRTLEDCKNELEKEFELLGK